MTLERGKRVVIPLMGMANIKGNLSLVFHNGLHVHIAQDLQPHIQSTDTIEAIDFGYTKVMTDTRCKGGIRFMPWKRNTGKQNLLKQEM